MVKLWLWTHKSPIWALKTTCYAYSWYSIYRGEINSLQIQLSRTEAGPGRAVKEQQEQNSPNHVQRINLISVQSSALTSKGTFDTSAGKAVEKISDDGK